MLVGISSQILPVAQKYVFAIIGSLLLLLFYYYFATHNELQAE